MNARMGTGPDRAALRHVVIVAYDADTGRIGGTVIHSAFPGEDPALLERSRALLVEELGSLGCDPVIDVRTIEIPLEAYPSGEIERVDVATGEIIATDDGVDPACGMRFGGGNPAGRRDSPVNRG